MPVKKKQPKKTKKIAKQKKDKKIKQDIKNAVNKIPSLFVEQIKFQKPLSSETNNSADSEIINEDSTDNYNYNDIIPPRKITTPKDKIMAEYSYQNKMKKFLWLIVIFVAGIVFSFWGWKTYTIFKDAKAVKNTASPFTSVKTDLTKALNEVTDKFNSKTTSSTPELLTVTSTSITSSSTTSTTEQNILKDALNQILTNSTTTSTVTSNTSTKIFPISPVKKTDKK